MLDLEGIVVERRVLPQRVIGVHLVVDRTENQAEAVLAHNTVERTVDEGILDLTDLMPEAALGARACSTARTSA